MSRTPVSRQKVDLEMMVGRRGSNPQPPHCECDVSYLYLRRKAQEINELCTAYHSNVEYAAGFARTGPNCARNRVPTAPGIVLPRWEPLTSRRRSGLRRFPDADHLVNYLSCGEVAQLESAAFAMQRSRVRSPSSPPSP